MMKATMMITAAAVMMMAVGDDDRYQADVMRLAPMPKEDQSKRGKADDN